MKDVIRKELIEKRKKMSKKEVLEKNKLIKKRLFEINEFKKASTILFYVSYGNEVYTHDMIKEALNDKKVVVPISNKEDCSLSLSILDSWNDLEEGSYGILEPRKDCIKEISIDEIDLIIVPGVGFDLNGNRLGHGKGYYDRLLEKTKAISIGLAFELQIVKNIPTDRNDVPVDIIVTEERIIECI
jgi:5-formyltetrahydrofolate cyclo-ligase